MGKQLSGIHVFFTQKKSEKRHVKYYDPGSISKAAMQGDMPDAMQ